MRINSFHARVIRNSRGEDAIEVIVNKKYIASSPSGASTGVHEVSAYPSKGVRFAVTFLNKYPHFKGFYLEEFSDLSHFDSLVSVIGGNAVVALQLACLKAMSQGKMYSFLDAHARALPIPLGNCVGGGAHARQKTLDIQEFLLVPHAKSFFERAAMNRHVYDVIGKMKNPLGKTDEGAHILSLSDEGTFSFLSELLDSFHSYGMSMKLGVDMAASQFYSQGKYHYNHFSTVKKKVLNPSQQITLVNRWVKKYGLVYVEDPLQEEDFSGFAKLKKNTLVCGDDLITTNIERLKMALKYKSVNAIIVKPNQIGSLVKTKELVDFARKKGITMVLSHRSGETMDASLAHLAVGWRIPYIKIGIFGKEREVKLQELIKIEKEIL